MLLTSSSAYSVHSSCYHYSINNTQTHNLLDVCLQWIFIKSHKNRLRIQIQHYSLIKSITDPTFIVALNVCSYTVGFTKPLSVMLQATSADIIKAYNNINLVQTQLQVLRKDCDQVFDESIWKNATHMATIAETELIAPRICQRMTKRSNTPARSSKDYFKVAVLIPTIDHLLSELEFRFSQIQVHAACGMYLIPKNLQVMSSVHHDNIFQFFE